MEPVKSSRTKRVMFPLKFIPRLIKIHDWKPGAYKNYGKWYIVSNIMVSDN